MAFKGDNRRKQEDIRKAVDLYRSGLTSRRDLLKSLIAATGSYAAAHLFLESSGLAQTMVSDKEANAANVSAETVHFSSGDVQVEGYLAKPKAPGKHPAVIVIHENRGLNEHIRDVTRRFATEGFLALAPDLLSRLGGTAKMKSPEDATEAIGSLPPLESVSDLKASFEFLQTRPDVDAQKIASVGFCWGGWRSFMLATMEPKLYRGVVFYGSSPDTGFDKIQAPVLAHYAKWDNRITGNALWTDEQMKKAGKKYQYYVYDNTDHAFFNDTGPRYNADAAKLAWKRTLDFLRS